MKNVIVKQKAYKDYGIFTHIYCVDVNYDFNEKSVEEIVKCVKDYFLFPVMIHTNDISVELVSLLKKLSELSYIDEIWLNTSNFLFEYFADIDNKTIEELALDNIDYMIDALGDEIDFKGSLVFNELIKYEHIECPF